MRRPIAAVLLVIAIAGAGYVTARVKRDFWDFEVYHQAGIRTLAAEPLYRPSDGHYQFKYWPAFAVAMVPFALLPTEAGKIAWYSLSIVLLAIFIRRSITLLPDRRSTHRVLVWWTLLLTGKFIVKELVNGQTNALLGVLMVLALGAMQARRPARAGALVALAAFAKPYALIFLPWLTASHGWRAASAAVAVLAAGWVVPAAVYGWQGNLALHADWLATVVDTTPANLLFPENISFAAMGAKWLGTGPAASVLAVIATAGCLGVAAALWLKRRSATSPAFLELAVLLLLVPLISPQGWDYVLLLGIPAIVCLVDRFGDLRPAWQASVGVGLLLTSFTIYDLLGRSLYLWLMSWSVVTVGALLLVATLAHLRQARLA